jgi:hypothetical protein
LRDDEILPRTEVILASFEKICVKISELNPEASTGLSFAISELNPQISTGLSFAKALKEASSQKSFASFRSTLLKKIKEEPDLFNDFANPERTLETVKRAFNSPNYSAFQRDGKTVIETDDIGCPNCPLQNIIQAANQESETGFLRELSQSLPSF